MLILLPVPIPILLPVYLLSAQAGDGTLGQADLLADPLQEFFSLG